MTAKIQKFEDMLDLEFDAGNVADTAACQLAGVPAHRMDQMRKAREADKAAAAQAKRALYAAMDALTAEELREYGAYRARVWAEYASRDV